MFRFSSSTRRALASFRSQREGRVSVPGCALLAVPLCLAQAAWAQSSNAPTRVDEPVVVTGTRTPQRVDQALADTTVIDRARIEQATGRTLTELLAQQAGIQFWSNGGAGKTGTVSLRGLEARHTLLLVDGVRYGSATVGTPTWETIPLDSIERIEIVRGPLSGLYGGDAVGGVIQIFTRSGTPGLRANASATVGSHGMGEVAGGVRFGQGAFDGAVQLSHSRTRGFSATNADVPFGSFNADDDGFQQSSASTRLGWRLTPDWRLDFNALASRGETQLDDGPGVDARADLRAQVLGLQLAGKVSNGWRTSLRASRSKDEYETLSSASPWTDLGSYATTQQQLSWENTVATPWGSLLLLAERLAQKVAKPADPYDVSERTVNAVAAGLNGSAKGHHWQANVRHDRNSQFGKQTTGSAAYGMEVATGLRATASWGRTFVAPSFNQLYFPFFGNPNLLPEEGTQREFSLRWQAGGFTSRVAYFDNRIRGYISSGPQPANIPTTRIDGVSASTEGQWGAWMLAASIDSVNPVNSTTASGNFGKRLPNRVQESARVAVDWNGGAIKLGATLVGHGDRFADAANTQRVAGFGTLDVRADWQLARAWGLGLKLNNLAGQTYQTVHGYNQPGREAFLTLRYSGL